MVRHKTVSVDGLSIFYREAGEPTSPRLVLLHGFPASSHQYRASIPALAGRFRTTAVRSASGSWVAIRNGSSG